MNNTNLHSHCTAKDRDALSFPAKIILNKKLLKGDILDFGCGFGKDVEILKQKGFSITGYDPHYFPEFPEKKFDTIICFYVLNVLLPEQQAEVLMNISALLKPSGKAYFAVRRDLQFEGYRMHKLHKVQTYQCLIKLPYRSILLNDSCEIYEYQHYTTLHLGDQSVSPFFNNEDARELLFETATAFSFFDKYPVSKGHTLVVPKRQVSNYFELSIKEQMACWLVVNKVKKYLQDLHNPDGFNIGINVNQAAGQTVGHAHIHVIPRYNGDVETPRGGVRGVIPQKKEY